MNTFEDIRKYSRREALAGMSGAAAFLAMAKRGEAQESSQTVATRGTARVVIFVNLDGGPSHLDTFDVKDAGWNPADVDVVQSGRIALNRGFFPKLVELMPQMCLLRSVSSWEAEHSRGQFYLQTAHPANPAFIAETPHIGAVVALEKAGTGKLPPFISLNGSSGQGATFLGGRYEPMNAPANQGGFTTITHNFFGAQSQQRFDQKFSLLEELEAEFRKAPFDPRMAAQEAFYAAAKGLMYDPVITQVFQFSNEDRLRYGSTNLGNSCLVARNAVRAQAGAAFINIRAGGWDTHQGMFDRTYPQNFYTLTNQLDSAVGNLAADLLESGHLSETLIVLMGEFGRTPGDLNSRGGRDHHKSAMSVAMIGGGVRGGHAIGATDATGERIIDVGWRTGRVIYPEDITATLYSALGINWTKRILETPTGRIFEYIPGSVRGDFTAVDEVFA